MTDEQRTANEEVAREQADVSKLMLEIFHVKQ